MEFTWEQDELKHIRKLKNNNYYAGLRKLYLSWVNCYESSVNDKVQNARDIIGGHKPSSILNWMAKDGNNVLHLAVQRWQSYTNK